MDSRFQETAAGYSPRQAVAEAKRCLRCKVPACKQGCPIQNDIPEWIAEITTGNFGNAMRIINTRSNLPAVCGRVCAHERQCEGHCVLNKRGEPVHIGRLERFVADFASDADLTPELMPAKGRGRVAVIGSGPAGLTIAGDLARRGFAIEIFEMEAHAGGVLRLGIPDYRLPGYVVEREIRRIENLGVAIHLNTTVGEDITIDDLFARGFDAIFIGTGTGRPRRPDIPGINHYGVRQAIRFLRRVSLYRNGNITKEELVVGAGDRVAVIGCGNTAIDAARTALKIGAAQVTVIYHRDIEHMPALHAEYADAVAEGVEFMWHSEVTAVHADNARRLRSVTVATAYDSQTLDVDWLILAIGSRPADRIISTADGIEVDDRGYVVTLDKPYGMSTRRGVFAGGDVTTRTPATVVHAMQDAKRVADGITQYVDAVRLLAAIP